MSIRQCDGCDRVADTWYYPSLDRWLCSVCWNNHLDELDDLEEYDDDCSCDPHVSVDGWGEEDMP